MSQLDLQGDEGMTNFFEVAFIVYNLKLSKHFFDPTDYRYAQLAAIEIDQKLIEFANNFFESQLFARSKASTKSYVDVMPW